MPKATILILLSFLLLSISAAAQDAISTATPGIARFPYTKAPVPEEIANGEPANLINATTYAFSAQSGIALEDMSSGTTTLIGGNRDNDSSAATNIGFLFRYDGVFFTTFGANVNGLFRLGGATASNIVNILNSVENAPKIAPYWDNICTGTNGKVHYKLVPGPVGTQKLVIEWKNMTIPNIPNCGGTGGGPGAGTFQLWLYDRTGVIQFVYGSGIATPAANQGGYSIGIQSGAATNFASVTTATTSVSYTTANNTQFDPINEGTSYLFSPNIPAAVTGLNASAVGQGSVTINWTDNATDETVYLVRRTTDMVNFYFVADTLPPNSNTFTDTGLAPGTQYFYFVNALNDGAFSPDTSLMVTTGTPGAISSTAAGGPWSAPSTWVGGIVPDSLDNVTISGAVTIDTAGAVAGNVTVNPSGFLKFGETGAFKLTVTYHVVIDAGGTFSTGSGTVNQHILSVGRNLTNNGTLDFSTNNDQAAAGIVFTGVTSNTFGGTGPVTDISTITLNKGNSANILELAPANFTVQGTTTDGPVSGFLFLNSGTFKISGTFTGTHRTFVSPNYQVIAAAGLWLNNPNYTIAAQNGTATILGLLRVSAGTYNIGTAAGDGLGFAHNSTVRIEGGSVNTSGSLGSVGLSTTRVNYTQTGGTVTTCTVRHGGGCFDMGAFIESSVTLSGGDIIIQNSQDNPGSLLDYRNLAGNTGMILLTGTTVHFGNALTNGSGLFTASGRAPNVVLSANHSLQYPVSETGQRSVRNFTIEQGATLHGGVTMHGDQFINNGTINAAAAPNFTINSLNQHVIYSGTGTISGVFSTFTVNALSFTISPEASNIRTYSLSVASAAVINTGKFIIGNGSNDNLLSQITFTNGAGSLDTHPNFDTGPGGLRINYGGGARISGPEIPSNRTFAELRILSPGLYTITGGDLTVNTLTWGEGMQALDNVRVVTGENTITVLTSVSSFGSNSYINGTLRRPINNTGGIGFPVGVNGSSSVGMTVTARTVPSYISVRPLSGPLPGLLLSSAVQHHWKIVEEGDVTATVVFSYPLNFSEYSTYRIWHSSGGAPQEVPFGERNFGQIVTAQPITEFNGEWGVGPQLDPGPVSISGRVTTSGGNPIRNAAVTISGGNLPSPVTVLTGSFGTYVFSGLQAGVSYNITASAKRYRFPAGGQNVVPAGNVENVDFVANPQDE